jgi:superfamily II DNA/RNA helicase
MMMMMMMLLLGLAGWDCHACDVRGRGGTGWGTNISLGRGEGVRMKEWEREKKKNEREKKKNERERRRRMREREEEEWEREEEEEWERERERERRRRMRERERETERERERRRGRGGEVGTWLSVAMAWDERNSVDADEVRTGGWLLSVLYRRPGMLWMSLASDGGERACCGEAAEVCVVVKRWKGFEFSKGTWESATDAARDVCREPVRRSER